MANTQRVMRRNEANGGMSEGSLESQDLSFNGMQKGKRSHQYVARTPAAPGLETSNMIYADHRQRSNSYARNGGRPMTSDQDNFQSDFAQD
jgi:hypothetical protein